MHDNWITELVILIERLGTKTCLMLCHMWMTTYLPLHPPKPRLRTWYYTLSFEFVFISPIFLYVLFKDYFVFSLVFIIYRCPFLFKFRSFECSLKTLNITKTSTLTTHIMKRFITYFVYINRHNLYITYSLIPNINNNK